MLKDYDIDSINLIYLKKLIKYELSLNIEYNYSEYISQIIFPKLLLKNYENLTKKYGCNLVLKYTNDISFYRSTTKTIYLGVKKYINSEIPLTSKMETTFFHELAHHIQRNNAFNKGWNGIAKKFTLEYHLMFERTAERLVYFLCKAHYKFKNGNRCFVHHSKFSAYKSKKDMLFLKEYMKKENRLLV